MRSKCNANKMGEKERELMKHPKARDRCKSQDSSKVKGCIPQDSVLTSLFLVVEEEWECRERVDD